MTDKEILEKAVQKAIDGGYKNKMGRLAVSGDGRLCVFVEGQTGMYAYGVDCSLYQVIFNHDFAKALWGDRFINPDYRDDTGSRIIAFKQTAWKHHLRQMVIADNPIKYLGENI